MLNESENNQIIIKEFTSDHYSELLNLYSKEDIDFSLESQSYSVLSDDKIVGVISILDNNLNYLISENVNDSLVVFLNEIKDDYDYLTYLSNGVNNDIVDLGFKYKYSFNDEDIKQVYQLNLNTYDDFVCLKYYFKHQIFIESDLLKR